jgi:ATP-dependent Lon protease
LDPGFALDGSHRRQPGCAACCQDVLEEYHFGLPRAKERVLEYIASKACAQAVRQPILCFVGPPGTGKTSLGRSISEALGRKFVRLSLGGVRDEAEFAATAALILAHCRDAFCRPCAAPAASIRLFMLDEIDKLGQDFRGDPASALAGSAGPRTKQRFLRSLP